VTATSSSSTRPRRGLLEILAVVFLGVATIGSAWCGYQATRWNGEEADLARESARLQLEASRQFGLAVQTMAYDSNAISQYANAVASDNADLTTFFREVLIRPGFLPVLDAWQQQIEAGSTPQNLLEDEEYREEQLGPYRQTQAAAEEKTEEAQEAGDIADDYVLTTLVLASALFFAGLTTSFRVRVAQLMLLAGSGLLIAYAASRLVELNVT
jgi:hypothetical protein